MLRLKHGTYPPRRKAEAHANQHNFTAACVASTLIEVLLASSVEFIETE